MVNIKFGTRVDLVTKYINSRIAKVAKPGSIDSTITAGARTMEIVTQDTLLNDKYSMRDPSATEPHNILTKLIAENIKAEVSRRKGGHIITCGIGRITKMDQLDPLKRILKRKPKNGNIRLWRILQFGVDPFSELKARDPEVPMIFWWKRNGIYFVGKSEKYSSGYYKGKVAMVGRAPFNLAINHPGQKGRLYIEKARYEVINVFQKVVSIKLRNFLNEK
jgi:hypothetical protein